MPAQKVRSWLDDSITPDYAKLSAEELLALWRNNRNSTTGGMAADEILRRVLRAQLVLMEPETPPPTDDPAPVPQEDPEEVTG